MQFTVNRSLRNLTFYQTLTTFLSVLRSLARSHESVLHMKSDQSIVTRNLRSSCAMNACHFVARRSVFGLMALSFRMAITAISIVFWMPSLTPSPAFAQEKSPFRIGLHMGYVPGDAFFPVDIKESVAETLSESALSGATELRYRYAPLRPDDMTLPQYLGFEGIVLKNVDAQGVQIIQRFSDFVDRDTLYLEKESLPRVLIMNRDFDWEQRHFFLRYNENWRRLEPEMFPDMPKPTGKGVSQSEVLPSYYQPHLRSMDAVIEDWENAEHVPSLRFRFPATITFERIDGRRLAREPITVEWKDVVLIGFPGTEPDDAYRRAFDSTFFSASSDGVSRYRWTAGEEAVIDLVKEWSHLPDAED